MGRSVAPRGRGFTVKCLELLEDAAFSIGDLFDALLMSGYGASYSAMMGTYTKKDREGERRAAEWEREYIMRQRYYSMLYKLRKDGLVREDKSKDGRIFIITPEGKKKLRIMRTRKQDEVLPFPRHQKIQSPNFTLVVFDIPERERRKRVWLRAALFHMGFMMVQKSVWMGKIKIPKQFLDDLRDMKLMPYVEIFEITKTGTLHVVGKES